MDSDDSYEDEPHSKKPVRIVINVANTQYPIVKEVAHNLNWKLSFKDPDDSWDVCWIDTGMTPERLYRMKPYQKINHFPGMYTITRKNTLAVNLKNMQKVFPEQYNFFPPTWVLPGESRELRLQFNEKHAKTFIVKPEAGCQGRGIFLVRRYEDIPMAERFVVQRYLHRPLLIDGLKFDMRVYVLVAGCDPLRVFIHEEGLARLATETYVSPLRSNLSEMCVHLTNYAINKNNPNFIFNNSAKRDDIGHKKSLTALFRLLKALGYDTAALWLEIRAIVVKTMCCAQPMLRQIYHSCQPSDVTNGMCFEILGFDIFLDHKCKPWLLEVNHSPSFTTDTPLDHSIKDRIINDAVSLLGIAVEKREQLGSATRKGTRHRNEREARLEHLRMQRKVMEEWRKLETEHKGGFQPIYPSPDTPEFDHLLECAIHLWTDRNPRSHRIEPKPDPPKPKPKASLSPFKWLQDPSQEEPVIRRSSVITNVMTQARLALSESPQPRLEPVERVTASLRSKVRDLQSKAVSGFQDRMLKPLANGVFLKPKMIDLEGLGRPRGTGDSMYFLES